MYVYFTKITFGYVASNSDQERNRNKANKPKFRRCPPEQSRHSTTLKQYCNIFILIGACIFPSFISNASVLNKSSC